MAEYNFLAEAFTLLAVGLVVIALRLYSRCVSVGVRRLAWDDFLMVVAGVCHNDLTIAHLRIDTCNSASTQPKPLLRMSSAHTGKVWQIIA